MRYCCHANEWLDGQLNGIRPIGIPWVNMLAFMRIITNPRLFENASTISSASAQVESWLNHRLVWTPEPTDRHQGILNKLIPYAAGKSSLVPDAHLAALCLEHGLTCYSSNRGFRQFPDLKLVDPL